MILSHQSITSTLLSCPMFQNLLRSVLLLLITIFLVHQPAAAAENNVSCPPSSCGGIHGITHPFRLDTDPPTCGFSSFRGDKNFTLSCHNSSSLFLYLNSDSSRRFLVKGINYYNFTIHLVDPGIQPGNYSSLPITPIDVNQSSYPYYTTYLKRGPTNASADTILSRPAVLISCDQKQVNNSTSHITNFVEVTYSLKSQTSERKKYSYLIVGMRNVSLEQVMPSCSIDMITLVSFRSTYDNVTWHQEIYTQFSDGFHLSWFPVFCKQKCSVHWNCFVDEENRPTCLLPNFHHIYYHITAWFLLIYGTRLAPRRHWGPIFKTTGWLIAILTSLRVVIFLLGTLCVVVFLIYQWRRRHLSSYDTIEKFLQNQNDLVPIRYSYKDIKRVTSCFKEKLGEGSFGCVYKGKLRSGRLAAIKILGKSSEVTDGQDFMNEVATIGRIHHVNVIQLVGYCVEQSKCALVYDFMSNGSLDKYIFPREGFVSLSWDKLFEISLGVARGIEYLHRGCDMQILHFDIKPHNILLDENFIPKISDFGLAKLYPSTKDIIASFTGIRGTIGYMAPEIFYKNIGRVSYKADVYSFGMLLLKIAGTMKSSNAQEEKSSQIYFPSWFYYQVATGDGIEIGNNITDGEIEIVKKMIIVGLWCIQTNPINRPSMSKVVKMLEEDMESLEIPPKPSLCFEERPNIVQICDSGVGASESISSIESA